MLRLILLLGVAAGCAARHPGATLAVPAPESGRVKVVAEATPPVGDVRPIAVALTNGSRETLRLDARQVYVASDGGARVAPLAPGDAARRSGGHAAPGALRRGAVGAATGGLIGAAAGAISGAIQGGIGLATAAGSAVGALFGAIGGVFSGQASGPDVGAFDDRALHDAVLAPGFSATGYVYYPPGDYRTLEVLLTDDSGRVERLVSSIEPTR